MRVQPQNFLLPASVVILALVMGHVTVLGQQSQPTASEPPVRAAGQVKTANQDPEATPQNTRSPAKDAALPPTNDPKEIVRRAVETDHHTLDLARHYTYERRVVIKRLGRHGEVKSTQIRTFDVNFFYGQEYARLIAIDDKPLDAEQQQKEDEELEKFLARFRKESGSDRQKRLEKERKQREEARAFLRDVVNAYDFRLLGEEKVDGAESYVIEATPRPDFKPTQPHADILKKIKGRLWIEKKDYNWVKVEAEATDTISYGLILFRIHRGSHFALERTLVNNEVWLLKRLDIKGGARIALFKNENVDQEVEDSSFKKFVTSVKIVPVGKETPAPDPPK